MAMARTKKSGIRAARLDIRLNVKAKEKIEQAAAWMDRSMAIQFGLLLKRMMAELHFVDSQGRRYQFGSREGARTATYVLRRIK